MTVSEYFSGLFRGIKSLLTGMAVTMKVFWSKKMTEQYPENRDTLVIPDRFRGELIMPHDENNEHACTACGICEMNCPNGTIKVLFDMEETDTGRKKKVLDKHMYNLGMCTFCNLCVITCPQDAIVFSNEFENAIFTRSKLDMKLNAEGSQLREKKKVTAPVATESLATAAKAELTKAEAKAEKTVEKPAEEKIEKDEPQKDKE